MTDTELKSLIIKTLRQGAGVEWDGPIIIEETMLFGTFQYFYPRPVIRPESELYFGALDKYIGRIQEDGMWYRKDDGPWKKRFQDKKRYWRSLTEEDIMDSRIVNGMEALVLRYGQERAEKEWDRLQKRLQKQQKTKTGQ